MFNDLLDTLFTKFEVVKDCYQCKLIPDDREILEKYKAIVQNEFFPPSGFGKLRLSIAKKAISDGE